MAIAIVNPTVMKMAAKPSSYCLIGKFIDTPQMNCDSSNKKASISNDSSSGPLAIGEG